MSFFQETRNTQICQKIIKLSDNHEICRAHRKHSHSIKLACKKGTAVHCWAQILKGLRAPSSVPKYSKPKCKNLSNTTPQVQIRLQCWIFNWTTLLSFILQITKNTTTWKVNQHRPGQGEKKLNTANNETIPCSCYHNFGRVQDLSHNFRNNKIHVAHFQKTKQYFTVHTMDMHSTSLLGQSPVCDLPNQKSTQHKGFSTTNLSWLKFYKSSKFCKIGTPVPSLETTKIIINSIYRYNTAGQQQLFPYEIMYFCFIFSPNTHIWLNKIPFQRQHGKITTLYYAYVITPSMFLGSLRIKSNEGYDTPMPLIFSLSIKLQNKISWVSTVARTKVTDHWDTTTDRHNTTD